MAKRPTASSTQRLSEVARHVVFPDGIVTTGWDPVVAKCRELGVEFDPWQHGVGILALGKDAAGVYTATIGGVVLSIPRQVGKTFLVAMILIALCLIFPGMTWLWTSHHNRTSTKTFVTFKGLTGRSKIKPFMLEPRNSNGEQEIRFRNGSRILFGAREQGFGRGFDEVDGEVFDEAQILGSKALEDMVPATNQSRRPEGALLFFMGTPPRPTDPGEEFTARRNAAINGESTGMVYVEFSADKGADPNDQRQWAKANPSFPVRTPLASMQRMRAQLTDDASFLREGLGVWDEAISGLIIPPGSWADCLNGRSTIVGPPTFAVSVSPDRTVQVIGAVGRNQAGRLHLEVVEQRRGTTSTWVAPALAKLREHNPRGVVVDPNSAAGALIPDIEGAGVELRTVNGPELQQAAGAIFDAAIAGDLAHLGQRPLDDAVAAAILKPTPRGGSRWHPMSTVQITALEAVTAAAFLVLDEPTYDVLQSAW